ncbi:hypothetical protein Cabys_81 [Caldithrix abyssi DSM 13497]|uniref:Uncharacterized protein n=1 Tax=Caldithrix abyssi DSM 13497 TaxID=880073 RepID=A0A1J1C4L6_CALAY|nr:hypothetical protein Cabys_81 [Caldithrix abyssi DSM 13497]
MSKSKVILNAPFSLKFHDRCKLTKVLNNVYFNIEVKNA